MSDTQGKAEAVTSDELRSEYKFDYKAAQSNPFATFTLFAPVEDIMLKAICGRRRKRLLLEAIDAATRRYPTTSEGVAVRMFGYALAGEIYRRFVHSVTDATWVAEGGRAALKELSPNAVIAVAREWIMKTGGFETLPGIDGETARRLQEEMEQ